MTDKHELFTQLHKKSKPELILQKYIDRYEIAKELNKKERCFFGMSNQKMNKYLKEIAIECKVEKDISTHYGRHTFGTILCNDLEIPITVVKELMSHSKITQTADYVVMNDKIITTMLNRSKWENLY